MNTTDDTRPLSMSMFASRADLEHAQAERAAKKIEPGGDHHLSLLMAPHGLNFVTGQDREQLLAWARDVWAAAQAAPAAGPQLPGLPLPATRCAEHGELFDAVQMRQHAVRYAHAALAAAQAPALPGGWRCWADDRMAHLTRDGLSATFRIGSEDAQERAAAEFIAAAATAAPAAAPAVSLADELIDCVDRLGSERDAVDPRVWPHLLVYAPKPQPLTDERIKDLYVKNHWYEMGEFTWGACSVVVRAIERELRGAAAPADTATQGGVA